MSSTNEPIGVEVFPSITNVTVEVKKTTKVVGVQVGFNPVILKLGETSTTAYRGDHGLIAYQHAINDFHIGEAPINGKYYGRINEGWSEIVVSGLTLGETSSTAYRGDRGKIGYDHSLIITGNPHNVTKTEVGLNKVDNTSDANKPISIATQTALNLKIGDAPADGKDYGRNNNAWVEIVGDSSPLTTKGDLYTYSTLNARLPVGADDTFLQADSTQPTGLKYTALPFGSSLTQAIGDILGVSFDDVENDLAWTTTSISGASVSIATEAITINADGVFSFIVTLRTASDNRTELFIKTYIDTGSGWVEDTDAVVSDYISRDTDQDTGAVTLVYSFDLNDGDKIKFTGFGDTDGACTGLNAGTVLIIREETGVRGATGDTGAGGATSVIGTPALNELALFHSSTEIKSDPKLAYSSSVLVVENTTGGANFVVNVTDGSTASLKAGTGQAQLKFDQTLPFAIAKDTKANILAGTGSGTNLIELLPASGYFGIGITPTEGFHVDSSLNAKFDGFVSMGGTAINTNTLLQIAKNTLNPTVNASGANITRTLQMTSNNARKITGGVFTAGTTVSAFDSTGRIVGGEFTGQTSGTGVYTYLVGGQFLAYNQSTGTVNQAYAGWFKIQNLVVGGTITNAYGVFIENSLNNGTITNLWGVYQKEENIKNHFASPIVIGSTTLTTDVGLEVDKSIGAFLPSRMTTTERDALTATNGMIIYNTTLNAFNFYENGAWVTGSGLA